MYSKLSLTDAFYLLKMCMTTDICEMVLYLHQLDGWFCVAFYCFFPSSELMIPAFRVEWNSASVICLVLVDLLRIFCKVAEYVL